MERDAYAQVNALWTSCPPITREEAVRAAIRLRRKFRMMPSRSVRRCWISLSGGRSDKGWHRLVHDLSHRHSRREFPTLQPHGPHHAKIERDMVEYVLTQGWLDGKLAPRPSQRKARPSAAEKLEAVRASLKRWGTKAKRAATAIRKLRARERRLVRALDVPQEPAA